MKSNEREFYPSALSIAGSDSGGGAGIQADLRTFAAFGVFGCTAITAVTSQNPTEVTRVDAIPAEGVKTQIEAVLSKIAVRTVKTGMLFSSDIIEAVAGCMKKYEVSLIIDPVMISTSGTRLLEESAIDALMDKLMPLADWITPNIPEAELLSGKKLTTRSDIMNAAEEFGQRWNCSIILKSGHMEPDSDVAADIVYHDGKIFELSSPRVINCKASHGTGCTLSSALAAALALGFPWKKALRMAKGFVYGSLNESIIIGEGLEAMYPPAESYQGKTLLSKIDFK
jgi:hydroxymethylpyrimidine/phosphomethylpyrimidine kinase